MPSRPGPPLQHLTSRRTSSSERGSLIKRAPQFAPDFVSINDRMDNPQAVSSWATASRGLPSNRNVLGLTLHSPLRWQCNPHLLWAFLRVRSSPFETQLVTSDQKCLI